MYGEACASCPVNSKFDELERRFGRVLYASGRWMSGCGSWDGGVLVVGQSPGRTEALTGRFFAGASGVVLRAALVCGAERAGLEWAARARGMLDTGLRVGRRNGSSAPTEGCTSGDWKGLSLLSDTDTWRDFCVEVERHVRFENVVRCIPVRIPRSSDYAEKDAFADQSYIPKRVLERCGNYVVDLIARHRPRRIVAVGRKALSILVPVSMGSVRSGETFVAVIGGHECEVVHLEHPASLMYDDRNSHGAYLRARWFACAVAAFERVFRPREDGRVGVSSPASGFAEGIDLVRDPAEAVARMERLGSTVAVDVETSGLSPYDAGARVLTVGVSDGVSTFAFPFAFRPGEMPDRRVVEAVRRLLLTRRIVCHEATFEMQWFLKYFIDWREAYRVDVVDTLVLAFVLRGMRALSLDDCCRLDLGFALKDLTGVDRSRLADYDLDDVLLYNALDAKAAFVLHERYAHSLGSLSGIAERLCARIPVLAVMMRRGVAVDRNRVSGLMDVFASRLDEALARIASHPDVKEFGAFNPESPSQVSRFFFDGSWRASGRPVALPSKVGKSGTPSVDVSVLESISHPIAHEILEVRKCRKMISNYLKKFAVTGSGYVAPDGRVHTTYRVAGTVTARLSSSGPNLQNLPKRKGEELRSIFVPSEGKVFLSCDYAAIEVRGIAALSRDGFLIRQIREGEDIHGMWTNAIVRHDARLLARFIREAGLGNRYRHDDPAHFKLARSWVKNRFVFPLFYGSAPYKVAEFFVGRRGDMNAFVRALIDEFWKRYEGVAAWHRRAADDDVPYVDCPNGLRMYRPGSFNDRINWPVQALCADVCIDAMVRIGRKAAELDDIDMHPVMNIHDEIVFEVPAGRERDYARQVLPFLIEYPYLEFPVPLEVEFSSGTDFASLEPFDPAADR